jgi:hypothetical protein
VFFEAPLNVFLNWWLAHGIYLKTSNTPLDIYNINKLIYTLSMHENMTQVFLVNMTLDKFPPWGKPVSNGSIYKWSLKHEIQQVIQYDGTCIQRKVLSSLSKGTKKKCTQA